MPMGTVLNVFVDGVKPVWEDPACKEGGRFSLRVPKTHTSKFWEDLLLAMIGEQFSLENEVLGMVLSTKYNGDSIAVWYRHSTPENVEKLKADIIRFVPAVESSEVPIKLDHEVFAELLSQP